MSANPEAFEAELRDGQMPTFYALASCCIG